MDRTLDLCFIITGNATKCTICAKLGELPCGLEKRVMKKPAIMEYERTAESIDVSNRKLRSLLNVTLTGEYLKRFNASHNMLLTIPPNYFIDTPNLREIDLSFNRLSKIELSTFIGANKLINIDLAFNNISTIDDESFKHLNSLQTVDLQTNFISRINFQFSDRKPLDTLHLENNEGIIKWAQKGFCLNNTVKSIYYSWKDVRELQLPENNHFTVIFNEKSTFEGIQLVFENDFEFHCNNNSFNELNKFVAGPNRCENVIDILRCFSGTIEYLDLSGNLIEHLNQNAFERFNNLTNLLLKDVKLKSFDFTVLIRNELISHLDISFNGLTTVQNAPLMNNFEDLTHFKAAGNWLNNTAEILQNLNDLARILDLSDSVVALNSTTLEQFKLFQLLYLRNTSLSSFNFDPFDEISFAFDLDLSHNDLSETNFTVLSYTLKKLNSFRCANCQIRNALQILQFSSTFLHTLDLSGNSLPHIGSEMIKVENMIQNLNLSNMNISTVDHNVFRYMPQLKFINLSQNQLKVIDFKCLSRSTMLIDLEGNELIRIDNFNRTLFRDLKYMNISHNKFPCEYLARFVNEWNDTFVDDPWQQKHGEHCLIESSTELDNSSNIRPFIDIVFATVCVAVAFGTVYFYSFRRTNRNTLPNNVPFQQNEMHDEYETSSDDVFHIYEEIGPSTASYDKLTFDFSPMPLPNDNYQYDQPQTI